MGFIYHNSCAFEAKLAHMCWDNGGPTVQAPDDTVGPYPIHQLSSIPFIKYLV